MSTVSSDRIEHLKLRHAVYIVTSFVLVMWVVKAIELASDSSFAQYGVLPRTLKGTIGIFTGPLIHGDVLHLISNTLPILLLGVLLFYFYYRIAIEIFIWIYLVSGFWIWLFARDAYHIGASGIVYGMASFLFFSGIFRKSRQLMIISGIIIFLYGGMIYGMFPGMVESNVSWEAHFMGGLVGVLLSFIFRKTRISFESEIKENDSDRDDDDAYFGSASCTDQVDLKYTYKPKDTSK